MVADLWNTFPPRMRGVLLDSLALAGAEGLPAAEPDHLLAAVLGDQQTAAYGMLHWAGNLEAIQSTAGPDSGRSPMTGQNGKASVFSDGSMRVLHSASDIARSRGATYVSTEHLLLALAADDSPVGKCLNAAGFTPAVGRRALKAWQRKGLIERRIAMGMEPGSRFRLGTLRRHLFRRASRLPGLAWHMVVNKSLLHPKFVTSPYSFYRRLRHTHPIRRDPIFPAWVMLRHADVQAVLRDPRFVRNPFSPYAFPAESRLQLAAPAIPNEFNTMMLFVDPPLHTRIRLVFMKAFGSTPLQALRPVVRRQAEALLAGADTAGRLNVVADYASPLPTLVICDLMGLPAEDAPQLKKWSDDVIGSLAFNPSMEQMVSAEQSIADFRDYLTVRLPGVSAKGGENLICALLKNGGRELEEVHLVANCMLLLMAGHETTTGLIANGVLALLRHPRQLQHLREHPEAMPTAVEEILRFESPVQWTGRLASENINFHGHTIRRGELLLLSLGGANRDPAVFKDPDHFDVTRQENKHLAFGHGIHFCLGAMLARLEGHVALDVLLQRYAGLNLAQRRVRWVKGMTMHSPVELRLRVERRAAPTESGAGLDNNNKTANDVK